MSRPDAQAPDAPQFTHRETVIIILGLVLGMFLAALDQTIIATALPRIAADLGGVEHLSWIISAYLLSSTAVTPIYGKLSDLYGRKPMLQTAIVVFVLASLLCGLAQTMGQLILFRGLQGLGGGGLLAMAHATIGDVVAPRERGRYQGYFGAVFASASVLGPVLGGLFVDYLSWHWVFWINLPIGIAALLLSHTALAKLRARRVRHEIDYLGAVLIVTAVSVILLVTTLGGTVIPWTDPLIFKLILAGLILAAMAVIQEIRAREPILPPRLFANPVFSRMAVVNLAVSMILVGGVTFTPLFLQLVMGLQASASGLMLIPWSGGVVVGATLAGQLISRTGRYKIFPILGASVSLLMMLGMSLLSGGSSLILVGGFLACIGFGLGLILPVGLVAVQNAAEARDLGTATASITFFRSMGGSFGVALYSAVLIGQINRLIGILPGQAGLGEQPGLLLLHNGAAALTLVPAALQQNAALALASSFHTLYFLGAALALVVLAASLTLPEIALRTQVARPLESEI